MKKMNTNLMKKTKLAAVIAGMTMAIVTGCGKEAKITASAANMETEVKMTEGTLYETTDQWLQSGNYYVRTGHSRYHVITVKRNKKETRSGDNGTFTIALFDEYGNPVTMNMEAIHRHGRVSDIFISKVTEVFPLAVTAAIWKAMVLTGRLWQMIYMVRKMKTGNTTR